jgi:DNA (cytosine-5)-methyltransferase 1
VKNVDFSIEHEWASDYDSDSCNTYIKNICPDKPTSVICQDVKKLKIDTLSKIDCFAYGFPCNDYSIVGEQKGIKGKYGPLYSYGIQVINKFNPSFFVAENVSGLSSANSGNSFKRIINELKSSGIGYNLTTHLYKSEEYGIPQTRHRIIIVGIRKDLNLYFRVPKPTHISNFKSAREALENPIIPKDTPNHEFRKMSDLVVERLSYIKPGENVWNANLPLHLKLKDTKTKLSQIYKKLDPNKPSYTITGSGGGGTHGYHYKENRALTNRERARIQTFPDNFIFQGSVESVRKQIGMAVPPKLSEIIFKHILLTLSKSQYESVKENIEL